MNINKKMESSLELKISDWELDFYSRPIIESNGKKRWELIISPFFAEFDTFYQLCLRINARALTVPIPSAFCSLITKTSISRPIENFSLKLVMTPKPHSFLGI